MTILRVAKFSSNIFMNMMNIELIEYLDHIFIKSTIIFSLLIARKEVY